MLTARVSAFKVLSLKFRKYRFSDISYIIKKDLLHRWENDLFLFSKCGQRFLLAPSATFIRVIAFAMAILARSISFGSCFVS